MSLTVFNYDEFEDQLPAMSGMITKTFEFEYVCENTGDEDLPAPIVNVIGYYVKFPTYTGYTHYVLIDPTGKYIVPDKVIDRYDHFGINKEIERLIERDDD